MDAGYGRNLSAPMDMETLVLEAVEMKPSTEYHSRYLMDRFLLDA